MKSFLLVFLGGGLGSVLRHGIGKLLNTSMQQIPWGTLLVNLLGSLLIGVLLSWAAKQQTDQRDILLFVVAGFCGGFTTFSAFAYENVLFLKSGNIGLFLLYTGSSLLVALAAVFGGWQLGKAL